jgi:hypothetical protein
MRMIHAALLALALAPALSALPAAAQQPSQAEMAACMPDFRKLCSGVQPGGGRVLACLAKQKDQLTPDCRTVVEKHGG